MPNDNKHSDKLEKLIKNDLHDFYKELSEDAELSVTTKIKLGARFSGAMNQLNCCLDILRQAGA